MNPADWGRAIDTVTGAVAFEAANDDHGPVPSIERDTGSAEASGWDPFEVWRTRVRDARRDGHGEARA